MREIESVSDDLDVGGFAEGRFIHIAPLRDAHFGEAGATRESPTKDTPPFYLSHRWGDGNAREAGASIESRFPNLRHRFWDGDAREVLAIRESIFSNLRHRWGDDGILASSYQRIALRMDYGIAVLSGVIELVLFGNRDAREAGATPESPFPNLRHRWGDGDAREVLATIERISTNLRHRFWYGDAREAGATTKSTVPNLRN